VQRCRHRSHIFAGMGEGPISSFHYDTLAFIICGVLELKLKIILYHMHLVLRIKTRRTPQGRRMLGFAASALLHCALVVVLMTPWSVKTPTSAPPPYTKKYSVLFVHLQAPPPTRSGAAERSNPMGSQLAAGGAQAAGSAAPRKTPRAALSESADTREHRRFLLPSNTRLKPVNQTLVQMEIPPNIVLKQEIPLPTVLLWTQTKLPPPVRKQFVAPPISKVPAIAQSLPVPSVIEPPNQEIKMANLNLAAAIVNVAPRLIQPPAIAPPVSTAGQETAKEIPQIGLANSAQPSAANLISQPNTPLRSATTLVLPPANQIAPSDTANAGSSPGAAGTTNTQEGSSGVPGRGLNGSGTGEVSTQAKGNGGSTSGPLRGNSGASGSTPGRSGLAGEEGSTAHGGIGTASPGNGTGNPNGGKGANGTDGAPGNSIAGLTRIMQPKEGKFAVVVQGSPDSARYSESVGALSGKVVYTVYLRLGLRKNWILQYSPQNTAAKSVTVKGSATPLQAPWPILMMRLDRLSALDSDYIMVRGMLKSDGRFDQLAMVFPDELKDRDLLLNSLKLWEFRPASRDGEPVAVEVLLIIPRDAD